METVNKLILAFVTLIIGVILLGSISLEVVGKTDKTYASGETVDISSLRDVGTLAINESAANLSVTNSPTGWKVADCPLASVTYRNSTDDFTVNTDYTIGLTTGVLHVIDRTRVLITIGPHHFHSKMSKNCLKV